MNQLITFDPQAIKQLDGLYCLNDLHRLSGGKDKDKPHRFLRLDKTQNLIKAMQERQKLTVGKEMGYQQKPVIKTIQGGAMQGTYGSKKLVYAYAMWIDPYFYDVVLEVFDRAVTAYQTHTDELNAQIIELRTGKQCTSLAGHILCVVGKHQMPRVQKRIDYLLSQIQLPLPFWGVRAMNKQARKTGKDKGRKALYFSKWYYTSTHRQKANNRQAMSNGRLSK